MAAHTSTLVPAYRTTIQGLTSVFQSHGDIAVTAKLKAAAVVDSMIDQQASMQSFLDNFRLLAIGMLALIPFVFIVMRPAKMSDRGTGGGGH